MHVIKGHVIGLCVQVTHFGSMFNIPFASGSLDCETKCEAGNRKLSSKSGTRVSV